MMRGIVPLLACALLALAGGVAAAPRQDADGKEQRTIGLDRRVAEKLLVANEKLV